MDENTVIKVENLSKKFTRSIKRTMLYGSVDTVKSMIGIHPQTNKLRRGEFWSLKDVNFELRKGEILGIIGVNGSGKSTLLRLLTGIFPPDEGKITIQGSLGALIAVGAGFHPHMTGRENIYLNGIILGMKRKEIENVFDEIVKFADIGTFLDAPVSTYSSGMKVRLGFAIAIHRIPDILLIDEVLAVGDISFKKKCMDKMEEIKDKTSIIFISHNMYQIERLCNRVILLDHGAIIKQGEPSEVISHFYNLTNDREEIKDTNTRVFQSIPELTKIHTYILNSKGESQIDFEYNEDFVFNLEFYSDIEFLSPVLGVQISSIDGNDIAGIKTPTRNLLMVKRGYNKIEIKVKSPNLLTGIYKTRFKLKTNRSASLIEGSGPTFKIKHNPALIKYDGFVGLDFDYK